MRTQRWICYVANCCVPNAGYAASNCCVPNVGYAAYPTLDMQKIAHGKIAHGKIAHGKIAHGKIAFKAKLLLKQNCAWQKIAHAKIARRLISLIA